jgi:glycogen synthase
MEHWICGGGYEICLTAFKFKSFVHYFIKLCNKTSRWTTIHETSNCGQPPVYFKICYLGLCFHVYVIMNFVLKASCGAYVQSSCSFLPHVTHISLQSAGSQYISSYHVNIKGVCIFFLRLVIALK